MYGNDLVDDEVSDIDSGLYRMPELCCKVAHEQGHITRNRKAQFREVERPNCCQEPIEEQFEVRFERKKVELMKNRAHLRLVPIQYFVVERSANQSGNFFRLNLSAAQRSQRKHMRQSNTTQMLTAFRLVVREPVCKFTHI